MRSPSFERQWLEQVCRGAGLSGLTEDFTEVVERRLEKGAAEYGDLSFMERGHQMIGEILDEPADVSAWGVLYAQFLRYELAAGRIDADTMMLAQAELIAGASDCLRGWARIAKVRELVEEG